MGVTLILIGLMLAFFFYGLPAIAMWNYIRIGHSKNGQWPNIPPDWPDLLLMFLPFINIMCLLLWIFRPPWQNSQESRKLLNKFFNVKQ